MDERPAKKARAHAEKERREKKKEKAAAALKKERKHKNGRVQEPLSQEQRTLHKDRKGGGLFLFTHLTQ